MATLKNQLLTTVILMIISATVLAQPGGGRGFGGRGGPGGGGFPGGGFGPPGGFGGTTLSREVRGESVQGDLKLTDDQKKQLEEMGDGRDQMREVMGPIFEKMRTAETDEERQKLQTEMQAEMQKFQDANDAKVRKILNGDQQKRLQQIVWQRSGTRAFTQDAVVKDLGISADQKQKIEALQTQYDEARMALGFQASDEQRDKLRAEFEGKVQAVLSSEQQAKWKEQIGAPAPEDDRRRGGFGPGGPGPQGNAPPQRPAFVEEVPAGAQVMASFGAPAPALQGANPASPTAPATSASDGTEKKILTFNFAYAPWIDVLKLFAQAANLTLDPQAVPPGTFTYTDPASYTPTEALDVLNGYLIQRGYILVHRDEFLVCLNIDQGIPPNLVPTVSSLELDRRGRNELLTTIFPLGTLDVDLISNEIDQLKGPQGKVVGLKTTKAVMVTDIGSNLRRIKSMLETMAAAAGPQDRTFVPYALKHIGAEEAEEILRVMLGAQISAPNVSASYDRRDPRSAPPAQPVAATPAATIAVDPRTNTLLITASPLDHAIIKDTLATIDVDSDSSGFAANNRKPYLVVYKVQGADAREVTKTIDAMIPGIVVNEDGQNGKIHINATAKQHEEVAALIRQMDGLGGGLMQVAVIPLVKSDPLTVAATLRAMFIGDGTSAPTIEADLLGRQIMVRGNVDQVTQIKLMLTQMGEDGTGERKGTGDLIRTFPLSGRDPDELLRVLDQMWRRNNATPIRIITPEQRGPIREMSTPAKESVQDERPLPATSEKVDMNRESARNARPDGGVFPPTFTVQAEAESQPPPATQSGGQAPEISKEQFDSLLDLYLSDPAPQADAPVNGTPAAPVDDQVTMTILGDEILLAGSDPETLNRLEELIESTMQIVPPSTGWTVFTLQVADATETATLLEQLVDGANVTLSTSSAGGMSGMMGSMQNFGSGVMDMTGINSAMTSSTGLKIVTDPRLNALLVSGPSYKIEEVKEWLKVLDGTDAADSLRSRTPRVISVEYADVNDVYTNVKDLYRDYLEDNQAQARAGANALAAMFGGGRGGSRDQQKTPEIRMTISVDATNNNLLVSANEALFQEVKSFVETLDKNAFDANRTVEVFQLKHTSSTVVQQALGSLMPKVKIASSSTRSSGSSSSSSSGPPSSGGGPPGGGGPDPDAIRQMFEQRMRERMQGGGSPSGGGGPPGFMGSPGGGSPFGSRGGGPPGGGGSPFGSRGR